MIAKAKNFISDSVAELKKVTKPTKQETMQATIVAIMFMGFFAIVLSLLDWILRNVVWALLGTS